MKKILLMLMLFVSLSKGLKAQTDIETPTNNWFVSFSTGFCIGGPNNSMENSMNNQNFNMTTRDSWFGPTTYPFMSTKTPYLFMLGKRITKYGRLYLVIGSPTGGRAEGYNGISFISIDYNITQYTLGYQFSFPGTRFKLGAGPSLFVFKYITEADYKGANTKSSNIAGATLNIRMPLGKEKKLFGIELFGQLNMAPSATLGAVQTIGQTYIATSVSMTNAVIGITFAFRG